MDYEQELITTIHDLSYQPDRLEQRLTELSQTHPTAVLIPSLYEELGRPALGVIRDHLSHCPFVNNVIVCLYADTFKQYRHAVQFFEPLPQPTFVLWENGPGITGILQTLQDKGLDLLRFKGKGRAVWLGHFWKPYSVRTLPESTSPHLIRKRYT